MFLGDSLAEHRRALGSGKQERSRFGWVVFLPPPPELEGMKQPPAVSLEQGKGSQVSRDANVLIGGEATGARVWPAGLRSQLEVPCGAGSRCLWRAGLPVQIHGEPAEGGGLHPSGRAQARKRGAGRAAARPGW